MNIDLIYLNINRFPNNGEEVFADDFVISLGGGPMVIPIQLNRLGISTKLGTFLGNDYQSRIAADLLNDIGYTNVVNFPTDKKHPVVVTSVLSTSKERTFICYNEGANELEVEEGNLLNFYNDCSICFCPNNLELAKTLKSNGKTLVFDVGWTDDLSLEKIKGYLEVSDYFTPNEKEAKKLTNTDNLIKSLDILQEYTSKPIIKLGDSGCICKVDNSYYLVPSAPGIKPIDPTGAGDNFLTGLIYGIHEGYDLIDTLKIANILGGLSTEVMGCYRDDISYDLIMKYMEKMGDARLIDSLDR